MTQDFSNDLGGSAPTKEPAHPAPVSLAEVSAEEPANSEGGATRPTEEAPRPAGEPPLPAPAPSSSPAPIDQPRRPHRWRWVASLAGVVATDMMIQIVFSAVGVMLIELAAQAGVLPQAQAAALIDSLTPIVVLTQAVRIAAMWPWWRHVARSTLVPRAEALPPLKLRLGSVAGLALLGVGLQFVLGVALTLILPLFPDVMDEYTELMDSAGAGSSDFSLLSVLSVTVLAAVGEEIVCRGVMLEYALRAVSGYRGPASHAPINDSMFWIANALQAAAFGLLHLNIVQSTYAFLLGLAMGWVYWKTRDLRYPMVLHLSINAASYIIEPISAALPDVAFIALLLACLIAGARLFAMAWGAPRHHAPAGEEPSPNPPAD